MKFTTSLVSALAVSKVVEGSSLRKSLDSRKLDEYYGYGNGGENAYNSQANYDNFDEYLSAQMASQSFSFTGCSTVDNQYYSQTFLTYRLCDKCSTRHSNGCDDSNGDYIVSMRQFSEVYGEYMEQTTGQENSPFECVKADEYVQNYRNSNYDQQYGYGYGNQYEAGVDLFVGPKCTGGKKIELSVYYDDECTYPVKDMTVQQALGFSPNTAALKPSQCIECSFSWNYNGADQAELNPLCEKLLEGAGRCDRDGQPNTEFDKFWQDVISFVNSGGAREQYDQGQQNQYNDNQDNQAQADGYYNDAQDQQQDNNQYYDNDAQAEQYDDNAEYQQGDYNNDADAQQDYNGGDGNYYSNNGQAQQYNNGGNGNYNIQQQYYQYNGNRRLQYGWMDYNYYSNQNTCALIDSLPHTGGVWDKMKEVASNRGLEVGHLIGIIFAVVAASGVIIFLSIGWCCNKMASDDEEYETPYQEGVVASKPSVTVS